jgi:hypothetical protein
MYSNAMQASPGAYQSPHYKSQRYQLYQWALEEGIPEQVYRATVEKVEGGIRRSKGFANMVEEWIQYNIDHYVYTELCKYLRPVQHERRSNSMQLETDTAPARSQSRRARRTNQSSRALDAAVSLSEDAAVIHREDAAALVIKARV